jgi:hypothetical protein
VTAASVTTLEPSSTWTRKRRTWLTSQKRLSSSLVPEPRPKTPKRKLSVSVAITPDLVKQKHLTLRYFEQKPGEELPSEELNKPQYTKGGFSTPGYENLHELQKWLTTE